MSGEGVITNEVKRKSTDVVRGSISIDRSVEGGITEVGSTVRLMDGVAVMIGTTLEVRRRLDEVAIWTVVGVIILMDNVSSDVGRGLSLPPVSEEGLGVPRGGDGVRTKGIDEEKSGSSEETENEKVTALEMESIREKVGKKMKEVSKISSSLLTSGGKKDVKGDGISVDGISIMPVGVMLCRVVGVVWNEAMLCGVVGVVWKEALGSGGMLGVNTLAPMVNSDVGIGLKSDTES